ncbi:hypothetical protein lerEdw1_015556, partial [Lerista edwardsae]
PNKSSSWTSTPNDYNSMSDSQFLLGSQFCPENSQSALEFSIQRQGKSSQQNSQDKQNESSIFAKYQSKPQLFGGDGKEKTSLNFPTGGLKGVLEQFEENKKKIKEKLDSEVLNTFALNTKETLQRFQSSLDNFEKTLKSILDGVENLSKTMQETSQSDYGLILNALNNKIEMEQTLSRMEKSLEDSFYSSCYPVQKDKEISDLKSSLQLLKESLDQLAAQQNEQYLQLPSLLAELQMLVSAPRLPGHMKDSATQTSPDIQLAQQPYNSHLSVLDAFPGSQVISTVIASQGKENVNIQQRSHILTSGHKVDRTLCTSCSGTAVPVGSHEESWLLTQEPSQATPMRKVIKRDNRVKELNAMRHVQLNQTHIDNVLMQNHADGQKKLGAYSEMQTKSGGNRKSQKEKPKKCTPRKKLHSPRKKVNSSRCSSANSKQKITRKGGSKEVRIQSEQSKHPYRHTRNPDDSILGSSIVGQPKSCQAQKRKTKKSKVVFQSPEKTQHALNQQEMSQTAKRVNLSSAENINGVPHCEGEYLLVRKLGRLQALYHHLTIDVIQAVPPNSWYNQNPGCTTTNQVCAITNQIIPH